MEEINIVTINDNSNYGNRLQSYALATYLREKGKKVNVLWFDSYKNIIKNSVKLLLPINKEVRRFNNFNKFTQFDIKVKIIKDKNTVLDGKYIVGSDQVWNPTLRNFDNIYLLPKISPENRISYAASLGISILPDNFEKIFSEELKKFSKISVREEAGAEIVKEITNRDDVEVVLDPTLLLESKEWERKVKKPKMYTGKKYILCYFLGEISEEVKMEIDNFSKENNCEIINILDKNDRYYECGPKEFLFLEKNAFLICTDSYHASVFALIFQKAFLIFDRKDKLVNMNSRIETFLKKFNLTSKKYTGGKITIDNLKCNYEYANKTLNEERKKSHNFIIEALK